MFELTNLNLYVGDPLRTDCVSHVGMVAATKKGQTVAVVFFGTMELGRVRRSGVLRFEEGLRLRLHTKCRRALPRFRTALSEVLTYFRVCPAASPHTRTIQPDEHSTAVRHLHMHEYMHVGLQTSKYSTS